MLDWDDLRYFLTVAREGSFSSAARVLDVAQPTVGRRITALEKKLGAKLFLATPEGQKLSPTGQQLVVHAERAEASVLAAELVASGRDDGLEGFLQITASAWLAERVLAPAVARLVVLHPGLEVALLGEPRHLNLVKREADIAIRPSRFKHQDVVEIETATVAFGLYASEEYLTRYGEPDFSSQCEGHRLIAMHENMRTIPELDWLPRVAARARVVARAGDRLPMETLAKEGAGLACLPRLVGDASPSLRLLSPPTPGPERGLWLASHRDTRSIPRIKHTLAFLRGTIRQLALALCPPAPRA